MKTCLLGVATAAACAVRCTGRLRRLSLRVQRLSERCDSASLDGKMVGTAVLLRTRFFAKPIVFDTVKSRETKCGLHTWEWRVRSQWLRVVCTKRRNNWRLARSFGNSGMVTVLFRHTNDATLHDTRVNHNWFETTYLLACVTQRNNF